MSQCEHVCGLRLPLAAIHVGVLVAVFTGCGGGVKADRGDIRFMAHNTVSIFYKTTSSTPGASLYRGHASHTAVQRVHSRKS